MNEHLQQESWRTAWDYVRINDWVLVRDRNDDPWLIRKFDHYDEDEDMIYVYSDIAGCAIPFNHGLTTNLTIRDIFTQEGLDSYEDINSKS